MSDTIPSTFAAAGRLGRYRQLNPNGPELDRLQGDLTAARVLGYVHNLFSKGAGAPTAEQAQEIAQALMAGPVPYTFGDVVIYEETPNA